MRRLLFTICNAIAIAALVALALGVAGLLWWTGEGYCVGLMTHCVKLP